MNNKIHDIIKEHDLHPRSYKKIKKVYLIQDKKNSYILKLNTNNYDIYKYLLSRDFKNFPKNLNYVNDNYDLSLYIKSIKTSKEQKIDDYIKLLGLLHHKTAYTRQIDLDEIKEIYEKLKKDINNTRDYYLKLNDNIDEELFLSPSMYLLVRNISYFYKLLDYSENSLNNWYIKIQEERKREVCLLHNNIDLNHLINDDNLYLISWDKAYFDSPINDLESFYRKYHREIYLKDLLNKYESIHKLKPLDLNLLLIRLSIPPIIELTNNTYDDTIKINNEVTFLNRIYEMVITKT